MRKVLALIAVAFLGTAVPAVTTSCGFSCLAAGTAIATPCGAVPIEDVRVGDLVWSVDPASAALWPGRVTAVRSACRPCLALTTASGRSLVATAEHPFFVPRTATYRCAGAWLDGTGECVSVYRGSLDADVVVACRPVDGLRVVFDLTVDSPFHNFLADGVLVHNKSPAAPDLEAGPIAAHVALQDAATLTTAATSAGPATFTNLGPSLTLVTDPAVVGPGVVRATAAMPFVAILVRADDLSLGTFDGYLELTLPAPVTTVNLLVTLQGGTGSVVLRLRARAGAEYGPEASAVFPPLP